MMQRTPGRLFFLLLSCATLCVSLAKNVRADEPKQLLIGEVAWAGSSKSTADEWLELWNRSTQPVDLTGYRLVGAATKDIIFDASVVIPPQSALLVANYAASDTKSALAADPHVVTSTLSLPNDTLGIKLFDADGILVDEAGDGGIPPAGISSSTKASMIRLQNGSWKTADERQHFDEGIADFGTPGFCDGCAWTDIQKSPDLPTDMTTATETSTTEPLVTQPTTTAVIIEQTVDPEPVELPVTAPVTTEPTTSSTPTIIVITPPDIRLARVFPAPSSGKEWVELTIPSGTPENTLNGWMLYDASGKIMTLNASSSHIELASARLNNGGDTVELRRPDGSVAERMVYSSTPHDAYWEKNADQTAWVLADPNAEPPTASEAPEPLIQYAEAPTIELPLEDDGARVASETGPVGSAVSSATAIERSMPTGGEDDRTRAAKTATAKPKTTKTTKNTTATKKSAADKLITFDMLPSLEPNIRVAITGTVATRPGVLGKNQFVLLSEDGHGLLVYGTSKQVSPTYGKTIRVAGTLQINDDGLSLHMGTNDRWTETKVAPTPEPRLVNFFDAAAEDGWSLVAVTATVTTVNQTTATIDLGDLNASLHVKPASGYRLSRLSKGDTIRIRALADLRGDDPVLVVSDAGDIEIAGHAAVVKATTAPQGLPDWTPFGAAGITVALTQGFKKIKQLRDERRVEKLAIQSS